MTAPALGPNARFAVALEAELIAALGLTPRPLEPALAEAHGVWRGEPATLQTRHFAGGRLGLLRVATLSGTHVDIGNVMAFAGPSWRAPILGVDVVGLGRETLVAADLSPLDRDDADEAARLAEVARSRPSLPSAGTLPAWAADWFGPAALFVRVGPDERDAALAATSALARAFVAFVGDARPGADTLARVAEYGAAHRRDDRGLLLIGHIFGAAFAPRYLERAMFPAGAPAP